MQQFYDPNIAEEESALEGDGYGPAVADRHRRWCVRADQSVEEDPGVGRQLHGALTGPSLPGLPGQHTQGTALAAWAKLVSKLRKLGAPKSAFALGLPARRGDTNQERLLFRP